MIFVDTRAWFAIYSLRDANHATAAAALRSIREPLVTSDYVVDETLTLLRARGENRRAIIFGRRMMEGVSVGVVRISDHDFAEAWNVFLAFQDKAWSFTDCTSRVVMERHRIRRAFAFDDHFRQFWQGYSRAIARLVHRNSDSVLANTMQIAADAGSGTVSTRK